ncbi:hypothetical protein L2E82_01101 [Cichorium intybus]|uniref:Uncharacterized protein n=1 Tax=Cichorium intybus TaxID=13427 RepID=A0ACB9GXV2_CICIN|nr:hypothetical protein L2E82_01101 [Cichorium intybus]
MLALSPPLFSTSYGWPLENLIIQNLEQDCNNIPIEAEANSYHSLLDVSTYYQIQHDIEPENSLTSGGAVNGYIGNPKNVSKKLNHNASERDRRKKVNSLYAFLRSLLPMSSDQKKKVSIPGTVSCALEYIPELQKEVRALKNKKEKLLLCSAPTNIIGGEHLEIRNRSPKEATIQTISSVVSSVCVLGDKVVIQLISSDDYMNNNKDIGNLSKVLEYLQEEEDGLVLLNATILKCFGEMRFLNTLYLQVQGDHQIEAEKLKGKLCSLYQHH